VGFVDSSNSALANASTIGAILVLLGLAETEEHESAKDWIDLVAGLWLIVSPTVLGFALVTPASVNAITVGLLTVLISIWAITPFDEKIDRWWHHHVARH
jgi:ABC-type Fe3+ transport system permease subunit